MDNVGAPPMSASSNFLTPLLISMLGILFTGLAISAYHLILVKYCLRRQQANGGAGQHGSTATGVEEKILQTIPMIAYSAQKGILFGVDQTECVVCLGELEDGDMVRLLPNCSHAFHVTCIDKWFMAHTSCPVCRSLIVAPMEDPQSVCESNRIEIQPENRDMEGDVRAAPTSVGLLRHCGSLALPREGRSQPSLVRGLKRSKSMDQCFVIIDIQRDGEGDCSSSSTSASTKGNVTRTGSFRARSIRRLDKVSSKLLTSFSRKGVGRDTGILPY